MLNYSDDGDDKSTKHQAIRGRLKRQFKKSLSSAIHKMEFRKKKKGKIVNGNDKAFATKERSEILRSLKKSIGFATPTSNCPSDTNFNIDTFLPDKIGISLIGRSKLQIFEVNDKDPDLLFEKSIPTLTKTHEDHPDSFFKSVRILVLIAQYLAILPVSGTGGPNYKSIKFVWLHYKILYWVLTLVGTLFYFVCFLRYSLMTGIYTKAASRLIFFGNAIISALLMIHLGNNWKKINKEFAIMEIKFSKFGYPERIGVKFKVFTVIFLMFGLVEYLLSKLSFFDELFCDGNKRDLLNLLNSFFRRDFKEVFEFHSYNVIVGFLMLATNFQTSSVWAFQDLFLIFVSYSIAERFKQIRNLLERVHGQNMPIKFWRGVREDYNELTLLTKRIDTFIQKIMLLTIGNDLFFFCLTLFNSFQNKISHVKLIYFVWSFVYQLMKIGLVAFSAAKINDESKEPKTVLYSVPQRSYNTEVRRFLIQLTTNEVALTGCGFFSVTRSLILTIMGTVITYEIVLVQFSITNDRSQLKYNHTILT